MAKRRVYELAKDYGMKGPEFVRVLKNLGFDKVKTHMAVLDDADQMVLEVRLGAAGYEKVAPSATRTSPIKKKSPIRKKTARKKTTARDTEVATAVVESAETPAPPKAPHERKPSEAPAEPEPTVEPETPAAVPSAAAEAETEAVAEPTAPDEAVAASAEAVETPEAPPTEAGAAPPAAEQPPSSAERPPAAAEKVAGEGAAPAAPAERPTAARTPVEARREQEPPAEARPEPDTTGPAAPQEPAKVIRRLPQPERKAKILGRIDLSQETISDASRRSAPSGPRNPASVDRTLRQAAMQQFRARTAKGAMQTRRGPGTGRGMSRGGSRAHRAKHDPLAPPPGIDPTKVVQVEAPVSVKKLSEALGHKINQLLIVLMNLGVKANINSYLDKDQVELIALELGRNVEVVEEKEAEDELISQLAEAKESTTEQDLESRPPIVTFMGHVDHGKTTLLDALRGSEITKGEAGGITQHIGAYRIARGGHTIVILDTPGHAAFTQMRARGAQLTDVVVLVVASDDGVMPQTEEALAHAKAADVPLVVAVNKCDRPNANPMRVRQQLSALGVQPEEWGGDVQFVDISALTGHGLDELVGSIAVQAEILELRANPNHAAAGVVIEAKQTPAQGNVISLIVMDGTLQRGDLVLCGSGTGRIRVLLDDRGQQIKEARPGTPVEVLGLPELPTPGDRFFAVTDTKMAKQVAEQRASKQRSKELAAKSKARAMDLKSQLAAKKIEEVRLIIKADVMGSLEPIKHSLEELSNEEVQVRILHSALGGITETDATLADASNAIIVGFNSVPDDKARAKADEAAVQVRFYNVIYELIDDVKKLLEGMLSPEQKEEVRGHAEVRRVFKSSKFGNIAGCFVTDGVIGRNQNARLVRDGVVVHTGKISSLRREKDDAREVKQNFECGILLQNYDDVKEGDVIETYEVVELQRTLGE